MKLYANKEKYDIANLEEMNLITNLIKHIMGYKNIRFLTGIRIII